MPGRKTALLTTLMLSMSLLATACGSAPAASGTAASGAATAATSAVASETTTASETTASAAGTSASTAAAASADAKSDAVEIRIGGLTGPTTMGMVRLMEAAENGTASGSLSFEIAGTADELTPKLVKGELDVAAVPANLAAVLYNNTKGAIRVMAVNTLGVLYIVEKGETVKSLADLKGKTIYATGKGSSPEYGLRYLLKQNGIDPDKDVTIEWKSEPAEIVALLASAKDGVAMMPQPFVTVAAGKVEGLRVAVDLTKEWQALGNGSEMVTGVLVGRADFIEKNPEAVKSLLADYRASIESVVADPAGAAPLIEKAGIVKAAVAEKAIPACNLVYMDGENMKSALQGYLGVLFEQNPKSVGGSMPADDFYLVQQ